MRPRGKLNDENSTMLAHHVILSSHVTDLRNCCIDKARFICNWCHMTYVMKLDNVHTYTHTYSKVSSAQATYFFSFYLSLSPAW